MTTPNVFGIIHDPDCICLDAAGIIGAALEDREPEPCPIHEPAAVKAREVEAEREQHRAHARTLEDAVESLQSDWRAKDAAELEAENVAALAQLRAVDPLLASLHSVTGTPVDNTALNAPLSSYRSLQGFREMSAADTRALTRPSLASVTTQPEQTRQSAASAVSDLFANYKPDRPSNFHPFQPGHPGLTDGPDAA